jgi:succinate dehydrogenase / fumarate reductase, membrane anchor subunit
MDGGTELSKVRGLGSARAGTHHWTVQRLTAIANLLLLTWLATTLATLDLSNLGALTRWLSSPFAAVPLALLVISVFVHLRHGLTVLIEDYVHDEALKLASLVLLAFFSFGGMAFALFAIAKLAFTAATGAPSAG